MKNVKKLTLNDTTYPAMLRDIPSPPKTLYVLGSLAGLEEMPRLSVVGSRHVSPYGKLVTSQLVEEVAGQGVVIISGLALGVDALAHRAALTAGACTIAVLACGLNRFYPSTNAQLAREILEKGGAIISEYPEDMPPLRENFVARNRIVSGLGEALLVTEAAAKSGTLHTAKFALDQGRTVMAIPGNITSQLSTGTNQLIKTGAIPVTESSDILLALGLDESRRKITEIIGSSPEEVTILQLIASGISEGHALLAQSRLSATTFNQTLTMLELDAKIRPLGGDHWALR
jgi:DNA processing protein